MQNLTESEHKYQPIRLIKKNLKKKERFEHIITIFLDPDDESLPLNKVYRGEEQQEKAPPDNRICLYDPAEED